MTDEQRPVPPPLMVVNPDCPMCAQPVSSDADCFWCDHCGANWDYDDVGNRDGEWPDPAATRCQETCQPYLDNGYIPNDAPYKREEYRCYLDDGHDGDHAHPGMNVFEKGWW